MTTKYHQHTPTLLWNPKNHDTLTIVCKKVLKAFSHWDALIVYFSTKQLWGLNYTTFCIWAPKLFILHCAESTTIFGNLLNDVLMFRLDLLERLNHGIWHCRFTKAGLPGSYKVSNLENNRCVSEMWKNSTLAFALNAWLTFCQILKCSPNVSPIKNLRFRLNPLQDLI